MVLKPGDDVQKDQCDQVGNFPFGLLKDPDALALDPGALGAIPAVASKKQDYIDAFDANNLTVCNEDNFAKINTPFILHLHEKDEGPPPDGEHSDVAFVKIYGAVGNYTVGTYGPLGYTSDSWERRYQQSTIPGDYVYRYDWSIGGCVFDLENGPGVYYKNYRSGLFGSYYMNKTFLCQGILEYELIGINGPWEEMIMSATLTLVIANDAGTISVTDSKTSLQGYPSVTLGASGGDSVGWPEGVGWLSKSANLGGIRVSADLKGAGYTNNNPIGALP